MLVDVSRRRIAELSFAADSTSEAEITVARRVRAIDASHNAITRIRGIGAVFQCLARLDLSHNHIGKLNCVNRCGGVNRPNSAALTQPAPWLLGLPSTLRFLNLSHNDIETLLVERHDSGPAVQDLPPPLEGAGEKIDVMRGAVPLLPLSLLVALGDRCPQLEVLDLSHNRLSCTPADEVDTQKLLQNQNATGGSSGSARDPCGESLRRTIEYLERLSRQSRITHVNLSYNPRVVAVLPLLVGLARLETVELEGCGITDLSSVAVLSASLLASRSSEGPRDRSSSTALATLPSLTRLSLNGTLFHMIITRDLPRDKLCSAVLLLTKNASDDCEEVDAAWDPRDDGSGVGPLSLAPQYRYWWAALVEAAPAGGLYQEEASAVSAPSESSCETAASLFSSLAAGHGGVGESDTAGNKERREQHSRWRKKKANLRFLLYASLVLEVLPQLLALDGVEVAHARELFDSVVSASRVMLLLADATAAAAETEAAKDLHKPAALNDSTSADDPIDNEKRIYPNQKSPSELPGNDSSFPQVNDAFTKRGNTSSLASVHSEGTGDLTAPPPLFMIDRCRMQLLPEEAVAARVRPDNDSTRLPSIASQRGCARGVGENLRAEEVSHVVTANSSNVSNRTAGEKSVSFVLPGERGSDSDREEGGGARGEPRIALFDGPQALHVEGEKQPRSRTVERGRSGTPHSGASSEREVLSGASSLGKLQSPRSQLPISRPPAGEKSSITSILRKPHASNVTSSSALSGDNSVSTPPHSGKVPDWAEENAATLDAEARELQEISFRVAAKQEELLDSHGRQRRLEEQNNQLQLQLAADRKFIADQQREMRLLKETHAALAASVAERRTKVSKQYNEIEHAAVTLQLSHDELERMDALQRIEREERDVERREREMRRRLAHLGASDALHPEPPSSLCSSNGAQAQPVYRSDDRGDARARYHRDPESTQPSSESQMEGVQGKRRTRRNGTITGPGRRRTSVKTRSDRLREHSTQLRARQWRDTHPHSYSPTRYRYSTTEPQYFSQGNAPPSVSGYSLGDSTALASRTFRRAGKQPLPKNYGDGLSEEGEDVHKPGTSEGSQDSGSDNVDAAGAESSGEGRGISNTTSILEQMLLSRFRFVSDEDLGADIRRNPDRAPSLRSSSASTDPRSARLTVRWSRDESWSGDEIKSAEQLVI